MKQDFYMTHLWNYANNLWRSRCKINRYVASPHTAQIPYRKLETNIPRKGTAQPHSQFLRPVSVRDLYIPTIGLPIRLQENRRNDPGNI